MELGFDTIGNATLIAYDNGPILTTDPWFDGDAYFGSWGRSYEIPAEQLEMIKTCPYVWLSHGHPDHINAACLPSFKNGQTILLPDHVGSRINKDLLKDAFKVEILPDRKWVTLSPRIRVMCFSDFNQDGILLVEVGGKLIINANDAGELGTSGPIARIAKNYPISFLLSISGYGEADMVNFYDEAGKLSLPPSLVKSPIGPRMAEKTDRLNAKYFIPFSSFHFYQRTDCAWLNEYSIELEDYGKGYQSDKSKILPAFIRYDCLTEKYVKINPAKRKLVLLTPEECNDLWSDPLSQEDKRVADSYFKSLQPLTEYLDYVNLRVGNKDNFISFHKEKYRRGITFETPRNSLLTALQYEVFDDLLIGNFMKVTLHGVWPETRLYPEFCPYVPKYADNGRAKDALELRNYFKEYENRSFDTRWFRLKPQMTQWVMKSLSRDSVQYKMARAFYRLCFR